MIGDAFRWSESNIFRLPEITYKEQQTIVVHYLAKKIKQNSPHDLPRKNLIENMSDLVLLFFVQVQKILQQKTRTASLRKIQHLSSRNYCNRGR